MSSFAYDPTITIEFPSINAKADFKSHCTVVDGYYNDAQPKLNIGCHAAILSNFYLKLVPSSVKILDESKPWDISSSFGGHDISLMYKHIAKYDMPLETRESLYKGLVDKIYSKKSGNHPSGFTFIFMSDNMNSYSGVFPKNSGISVPEALPKFKTSDFVNWLVAKKIGVVVASPISRNQFHQNGATNFSCTQAFIWIPPNFARVSCPDTAFVSNASSMPSVEEWKKQVRNSTGVGESDFDRRVWRDGVSLINRSVA